MGMDQATVDAAFGLEPWGPIKGSGMYAVVTAVAVQMCIGDMVETAGGVLTPKMGNLQKVITEETGATGTALIAGAVLGLFDEKMDPVERIAASEAGDGVIAGYALVANHPDQLYIAQEDGDTSSIQVASVGAANIDMVLTGTPVAANGYHSKMELDSDTVATTATLALRIMGVHPDDTISAAGAAGNFCRFIVKPNPEVFHTVGVLA